MEFEWDSLLLFVALLGIIPILIPRIRKLWKWYHKIQSGGSSEDLSEHVARVEREFGEKEKNNETRNNSKSKG